MRLLTHHHLDTHRVKTQFAKLAQAVARDDFKSSNLKKLSPTPYWRLKLDQTHRLLVQFARHGDETVCLALEVILNHNYASSRFCAVRRCSGTSLTSTTLTTPWRQHPRRAPTPPHCATCTPGAATPCVGQGAQLR